MAKRAYENLIAWQEAHKLCIAVYERTKTFPREELYALTNQMRRSGYSVPTNIAEGNGRRSKKGRKRFLDIANGSLDELHYQTRLAYDLHYISESDKAALDDHIHRTGYLMMRLEKSLP